MHVDKLNGIGIQVPCTQLLINNPHGQTQHDDVQAPCTQLFDMQSSEGSIHFLLTTAHNRVRIDIYVSSL